MIDEFVTENKPCACGTAVQINKVCHHCGGDPWDVMAQIGFRITRSDTLLSILHLRLAEVWEYKRNLCNEFAANQTQINRLKI